LLMGGREARSRPARRALRVRGWGVPVSARAADRHPCGRARAAGRHLAAADRAATSAGLVRLAPVLPGVGELDPLPPGLPARRARPPGDPDGPLDPRASPGR